MLANALPGAKRLDVTGPDEYALTVSVGVGSVTGTYDGTFRITDKLDAEACEVRANAAGGPGALEVVAQMRMRDGDDGGALLNLLRGRRERDRPASAGVGQRLIGSAAKRAGARVPGGLDRQIPVAAGRGRPPAPAGSTCSPPAGPPPPPPGGTDPVVIALSVLAGFLLALLGVGVGRWSARR